MVGRRFRLRRSCASSVVRTHVGNHEAIIRQSYGNHEVMGTHSSASSVVRTHVGEEVMTVLTSAVLGSSPCAST
eukprot:5298145-Prymnesium_polylepis.1